MPKIYDRVGFRTDTTGTGASLNVGDPISATLFTPAEAGAEDGDGPISYLISQGNSAVEICTGTYSEGSPPTLSRTTIASKIAGVFSTDPIDLNGSATVRFVVASEDFDAFLSADDIDTDGTLAANSDAKIASQKATKTYADTKLSKSGGTLTGDLTLNADPSSNLHAATKQYVDGIAANLGKRATVRVATTANITISTGLNAGDSVDGVTLANGDRVLVKSQTTGSQNGIYIAGATPARATDFDTFDEHPGSLIAVEEGTANADTLWLCTANLGGTLGSTAIAFSQVPIVGSASQTLAGIVELATAAELLAGSDTGRVPAIDQIIAAGALVGLTDAATILCDHSTFINATVTLGGNRTLGNFSATKVGTRGRIYVVQPASGGPRTLSYAANFKWAGGSPPALSTAANSVDCLDYFVRTSTHVDLSMSKNRS